MGHVSVVDAVVVVEFFVALLALIFFVVGYVASSRGRALRTAEGRHMVMFRGSLVVFMGMGIAHNLVPDYAGRDAVRVAVVGLFALAAIQGGVLLIRAQRRRVRTAAQEATTERGTSAPR